MPPSAFTRSSKSFLLRTSYNKVLQMVGLACSFPLGHQVEVREGGCWERNGLSMPLFRTAQAQCKEKAGPVSWFYYYCWPLNRQGNTLYACIFGRQLFLIMYIYIHEERETHQIVHMGNAFIYLFIWKRLGCTCHMHTFHTELERKHGTSSCF